MARNNDLGFAFNPGLVAVDELAFTLEDVGLNVVGGVDLGIFGGEEGMLEFFDFKDANSHVLPVPVCLFTGLVLGVLVALDLVSSLESLL